VKITIPRTTNEYVIRTPGDQFLMSSSTKENQNNQSSAQQQKQPQQQKIFGSAGYYALGWT